MFGSTEEQDEAQKGTQSILDKGLWGRVTGLVLYSSSQIG
jgi:hypothetical protein